jgi:hypothetical protein
VTQPGDIGFTGGKGDIFKKHFFIKTYIEKLHIL